MADTSSHPGLPSRDSSVGVTTTPLADVDPEIAAVLEDELARQRGTLEMIASENFVPRAVLQAQGSVLTNKYAEGYPGQRYYGGCEYVDVAEDLARRPRQGPVRRRVRQRPAALRRAGQRGRAARADQARATRILGLELAHGGHLTHGMKINFSGKLYDVAAYGVDPTTFRIDMDVVRAKALRAPAEADHRRLVRLPAAARLRRVPRDRRRGRRLPLGRHGALRRPGRRRAAPDPGAARPRRPSTTHKTLGGPARRPHPRATTRSIAKKFNSAVFPGQQGGPLMHVIAAKAVAFKIAATRGVQGAPGAHPARRPDPRRAAARRRRPRGRASRCSPAAPTCTSCSSTCATPALDGQQAEDLLHEIGITVNRNAVPFDPRPPMVTSGLRIGTPALATRGFGDERVHRGRRRHRARAAARRRPRRAAEPCRAVSPPTSRSTTAWRPGDRADPRRQGDRRGDQGRARRAGRGAACPGHRPRPRHGPRRRRPRQPGVRRGQAP